MTLISSQNAGMAAGLTREQVEHAWFSWGHANAAKAGIPYEQYQGLTKVEVEYGICNGLTREQVIGLSAAQLHGIVNGLTRQQVEHAWFNWGHANAAKAGIPYEQYQGLTEVEVEYGICNGLTREQVIGLSTVQLQGIVNGLTRQQVEHAWFNWGHANAAKAGIPYEQYQGLTEVEVEYGICNGLTREQVIGLSAAQLHGIVNGLTRQQVEHAWFNWGHANAAKAGIPYEQYQGLTEVEIEYGIRKGLTREQLETLRSQELLAFLAEIAGLTAQNGIALETILALTPALRLELFQNWLDARKTFIEYRERCHYLLTHGIITELELLLSLRNEDTFLFIQELVNQNLQISGVLPNDYLLDAENIEHLIELVQGVAEIRKNARQLSRPVASTSSSTFKFFPDIAKQMIAAYTGNDGLRDENPIAIQNFKKP